MRVVEGNLYNPEACNSATCGPWGVPSFRYCYHYLHHSPRLSGMKKTITQKGCEAGWSRGHCLFRRRDVVNTYIFVFRCRDPRAACCHIVLVPKDWFVLYNAHPCRPGHNFWKDSLRPIGALDRRLGDNQRSPRMDVSPRNHGVTRRGKSDESWPVSALFQTFNMFSPGRS